MPKSVQIEQSWISWRFLPPEYRGLPTKRHITVGPTGGQQGIPEKKTAREFPLFHWFPRHCAEEKAQLGRERETQKKPVHSKCKMQIVIPNWKSFVLRPECFGCWVESFFSPANIFHSFSSSWVAVRSREVGTTTVMERKKRNQPTGNEFCIHWCRAKRKWGKWTGTMSLVNWNKPRREISGNGHGRNHHPELVLTFWCSSWSRGLCSSYLVNVCVFFVGGMKGIKILF